MKPNVQVNVDSRNDKESDVSIIRVRNSRTERISFPIYFVAAS